MITKRRALRGGRQPRHDELPPGDRPGDPIQRAELRRPRLPGLNEGGHPRVGDDRPALLVSGKRDEVRERFQTATRPTAVLQPASAKPASGSDGGDGTIHQKDRRVRLALRAANHKPRGLMQDADPIRHWSEQRVLRVE